MEPRNAAIDDGELFPLELRGWRAGDEQALLRCHNEVFAPPGSGRSARTLEHWRWKYLDNQVGPISLVVAAHATGELVGVYAAYPVRVTCRGRRMLGGHSVDHCIKPAWLKHGGGDGLFPRMARSFLSQWLGNDADQYSFVYGLPVQGWNSGAKKLGWQIVRDWDITFRELDDSHAPRATPSGVRVSIVDRYGDDVDALFAEIEPTLGVATVRDQAYLNWRYADRPDCDYTLFECRDQQTNKLRGVCVYGVGDVIRKNTGLLLDWLHVDGDEDAAVAMIAAAESQARADRTGMLCAVWNPMDPRFLMMQQCGYMVRATPWFLVVESALYDATYFREAWYFTLGDSDLA